MTPSLGRRPSLSRVDRVAALLNRPPEDLRRAMLLNVVGSEQRISTLSVRLSGSRTFRYSHQTTTDRVAEALGLADSDVLRDAMRQAGRDEGKTEGIWTMSVRAW